MLRAGSRISQSARALAASRLARPRSDFTVSLAEPLENLPQCGQEAPPTQRQLVEFTNGVFVGATTSNSALATVNIVVRAGSRFELPDEAGVSHYLRRLAYKSTEKHTAVYMTCMPQWFGMKLSCTGTRDAIVYSGTCMKDDVDHMLDVMCQTITSPKFYNWEVRYFPVEHDHLCARLIDAEQRCNSDLAGLGSDRMATLYDAIQSRAFRGGLGNSIYCQSHRVKDITETDIAKYHQRRFVGSNIGVFAAGIHPEDLVSSVTRHGLYNVAKGEATSLQAEGASKFTTATYEVRQENSSPNVTSVLVGQGAGLSAEQAHLSSLLFQRILGGPSRMEVGSNPTRLQTATEKAANGRYVQAQAVNVNYSDTGLFGVQVEAGRDDIKAALKAAVNEFTKASGSITEKELKAAKEELTADLLATQEAHSSILEDMAYQTLYRGGKYLVPEKVAERVNAITAKDVKTFAQSVNNSKHVLGQTGDLRSAAYVDDLGL